MNSLRVRGVISVVIPCYNASAYLEECLDSMIAQTYPFLELVIVNDGSTDDSVLKIQGWMKRSCTGSKRAGRVKTRLMNLQKKEV